ncbi:MAG: LysE family translocator [Ktedonobacteraceae bacterium]
MLNTQLLTFVGIATILTITPGVDTMLVIRNVLMRGRRAGLLTAAGICSALFCHATLSALGLSIILVHSAMLYEIVKLLGACYLCFLGCRSLWQTFHTLKHGAIVSKEPNLMAPAQSSYQSTSWWRSIREGFFSNILNPKVAVFYLAFLPQFINAGDPVLAKSLLLAGIHFVLGIVWLSLVTIFVGWLRALLTQPAIQRGLETVTGVVLIAFGIRLALEKQ